MKASQRLSIVTCSAMLAVLAVAPVAIADAPDWTAPVNVRTVGDVRLTDADFARRNVAITWQEPGVGPPQVGIRTSTDSGSSFGPKSMFEDARQSAVDICGGAELNAVYARKLGPANWLIERSVGSIDGDGFLGTVVAPGTGVQRFPDVACAGGRVFVSWFEREGEGDRLMVAHALRTGGPFSPPTDLGFDGETFFGRSLAVAGVSGTAYAVFARTSGDLRFKSWSIGDGPGFAVAANPTVVIGPGNPDNSASEAVIAAAGDRVAVAWFKCGGIFARVSNDRGATWGPVREVLDHVACGGDFGTSPRSIAIRGDRIVITYLGFGIPNASFVGIIRTNNDFSSFSDDIVADPAHDEHLVGYVTVSGNTRLAAAFDNGDRIRFRRQE